MLAYGPEAAAVQTLPDCAGHLTDSGGCFTEIVKRIWVGNAFNCGLGHSKLAQCLLIH